MTTFTNLVFSESSALPLPLLRLRLKLVFLVLIPPLQQLLSSSTLYTNNLAQASAWSIPTGLVRARVSSPLQQSRQAAGRRFAQAHSSPPFLMLAYLQDNDAEIGGTPSKSTSTSASSTSNSNSCTSICTNNDNNCNNNCNSKSEGEGEIESESDGISQTMIHDESTDATTTTTQQQLNQTIDSTSSSATLGDIMSGLVTSDGGTLASRFGIHNRLDRMALTANGNLQRLFSSYYDAPVHVMVQHSHRQSQELWNRVVHLTVLDQIFCSAHSTVTIHDPQCQHLVESGKVGLGQLFRYLDRLPTFDLLDAGYNEDGALWRIYELKCQEVSCHIREDFHPQAWEMKELGSN